MVTKPPVEVWMRGPVPGIPSLLQPVAHSLLQCREELQPLIAPLPAAVLWARPGGVASVGFHIRHAAGSLDRLFTYARGEALSAGQLASLKVEAEPDLGPDAARALLEDLTATIETALAQLRDTSETVLLEPRGVGRARLPSTVLGLVFHAAEHTQRHAGQAVTTAKIVSAGRTGE